LKIKNIIKYLLKYSKRVPVTYVVKVDKEEGKKENSEGELEKFKDFCLILIKKITG